ncbi:hypothetical protein QF038_001899 [Pseudarthrobacter sp. W1I19]|uniref:DUF7793 family protein n=1 Tax=Pseudarthrobacter sp. W1I19 TaxID=3042288 RepID=UPI00278B34EB|nr:hypothetical protein [Pseudarthrobacter sp. W1I19]MDQ0923391.1 hypothetical protein [Pseudarthrobacter sp. W1I19]
MSEIALWRSIPIQQVENQNHVMVSGGVIHLQWRAPEVTEENVTAAMASVAQVRADAVHFLLIELCGVRTVNYRVHEAVAAGALPVTRLAIVACSPVDWATAYFYVSKVRPSGTARLFTSLSEAFAWLAMDLRPEEDS